MHMKYICIFLADDLIQTIGNINAPKKFVPYAPFQISFRIYRKDFCTAFLQSLCIGCARSWVNCENFHTKLLIIQQHRIIFYESFCPAVCERRNELNYCSELFHIIFLSSAICAFVYFIFCFSRTI